MAEGTVERRRGLEGLQAWQRARELVVFVHRRVVPCLPEEEKWDLARQIRRASKSVMANIAEGYGRYYYQEAIRFCYIARGSLEETYSHLTCALDLGYIQQGLYDEAVILFRETQSTLNGYIAYLKRTKQGGTLPHNALRDEEIEYEPDDSLS